MSRVVRVVWLTIVWVALWGDVSAANVVSGVAVAVAVSWVFPVRVGVRRGVVFRPLAIVRLAAYFGAELVKANAALAVAIVRRRGRVGSGVVAVPMMCDSDGLLTMVAHISGLTPGMTVVDVHRNPATFYVHVLQLTDDDSARADVHRLESLVIEAFGTDAAVAAVRARGAAGVCR